MTPHQWQIDLLTFIGQHQALSSFSFRSSCLDNWSQQYYSEGGVYPSIKARCAFLREQGFGIESRYQKDSKVMERVFFRGAPTAAQAPTTFLFAHGVWALENEIIDRDVRYRYSHYRKKQAEAFAEAQRAARKRAATVERTKAKFNQRAAQARLEASALTAIRDLLSSRPLRRSKKTSAKGDAPRVKVMGPRVLRRKEMLEKKVKLALGRWRRHYLATGESLAAEVAIERKPIVNRKYQREGVPIKRRKPEISAEEKELRAAVALREAILELPILEYKDAPLRDLPLPPGAATMSAAPRNEAPQEQPAPQPAEEPVDNQQEDESVQEYRPLSVFNWDEDEATTEPQYW